MHDLIAGWFGRVRALFNRRAAGGAGPAADGPSPSPATQPLELPCSTPEPFRPHCGVYVWATAHGVDIARSSKLLTCTCSTHPSHPADGEALRAKVREVNARSTWGK